MPEILAIGLLTMASGCLSAAFAFMFTSDSQISARWRTALIVGIMSAMMTSQHIHNDKKFKKLERLILVQLEQSE